MSNLSKAQQKYLRGLANPIKPTVVIGKAGLSGSIVGKVDQELAAHELIKVRFLEFKDDRRDLTDTIVAETGADLVGLIGNVAILYRQHPDPERRRISFPEA